MQTLIENQDFIINFLIIWGFIQSLYYAIFMGLILRWNDAKGEQRTKIGKLWHGQATLVKIGIPVLWLPTYFILSIQIWGIIGIAFIWFNWVGWDGVLNMCRLSLTGNWFKRWFYSGSIKTGSTSLLERWSGSISELDNKIGRSVMKLTNWTDQFVGGLLPFMKLIFTFVSIIIIIILILI